MELEPGTISASLDAAATAIGVGMVIGGFVGGLARLLRGAGRGDLEHSALKAGYLFAVVCLVVRAAELAHIV